MAKRDEFVHRGTAVKRLAFATLATAVVGVFALAGVLLRTGDALTSPVAATDTVRVATLDGGSFIEVDLDAIEHVAAPPPTPPDEGEAQ